MTYAPDVTHKAFSIRIFEGGGLVLAEQVGVVFVQHGLEASRGEALE